MVGMTTSTFGGEYPPMPINEFIYLDRIENKYDNGGTKKYQEAGKYLDFDLGDVSTWPGFEEELSEADQAYWKENFNLNNIETPQVGVNIPKLQFTDPYDQSGGDGYNYFENMMIKCLI